MKKHQVASGASIPGLPSLPENFRCFLQLKAGV
jgi:hypothetical protein